MRDVYNVDRLAQAAAMAAIEDFDHFAESLCKIRDSRAVFSSRLHSEIGSPILVKPTLFLLNQLTPLAKRQVASSLYEFSKPKDSRPLFPDHSLTESFLRVTIGTDSEMETLNRAIDQWTATTSRN